MQLRFKPKINRNVIIRNFVLKIILVLIVLSFGVFLLDKIDFPAPEKLIKQKISNDKLITLK